MAEGETRYLERLNDLKEGASELRRRLEEIDEKVDEISRRINILPDRIKKIRERGYKALTHLEEAGEALLERWREAEPDIERRIRDESTRLRVALDSLDGEISSLGLRDIRIPSQLDALERRLDDLRLRFELEDWVASSLQGFETELDSVEEDLEIAESTLDLVAQASFRWMEGEVPIYAVRGKDMERDQRGILTLTSNRLLFESEREIVLKRVLFIATEKKRVREVVVDQPIGAVERVMKGRVGLLAGYGLYITFKPEVGLPEMKVDVRGHEADRFIRFYNYIVSGRAEEELAPRRGEPETKPGPILCPVCGAPYTDEIYRGQTSVRCKYCGAVIPLPR